jgi:hypothetical protein
MVHPSGSVKSLMAAGSPGCSVLTLMVVGSVAAELVVERVMSDISPHATRNFFASIFVYSSTGTRNTIIYTAIQASQQHNMYLPQITPRPVDLLLEKFYFPEDNRQIYVSHHVRHMPPFLHTHEFFEISYLLDGRAEHTIDG